MEVVYGEERTNYPLTLSVDDLGEGFALTAQVAEPVEAERVCGLMHRALESLVEALERAPERAVRTLEVLPEASASGCWWSGTPPKRSMHAQRRSRAVRGAGGADAGRGGGGV